MDKQEKEIEQFIAAWPDSSQASRDLFARLKLQLQGFEGVNLQFVARPGVTYSLRGLCQQRDDRPLFAMIDVIDDDPRWLSICFYGDMVKDPEQRGDYVPGGLLGADGICFDLDAGNEDSLAYVMARIDEACRAACSA